MMTKDSYREPWTNRTPPPCSCRKISIFSGQSHQMKKSHQICLGNTGSQNAPVYDLMIVNKMSLSAVKFLSNGQRGGRDNPP